MTPEQFAALPFAWQLALGGVAVGGGLYGIFKAVKEGAKQGNKVVVAKTDEQTTLLNAMAAEQILQRKDLREIKVSTGNLAHKVGVLTGTTASLTDGQRALQDTVQGLALAHVQLDAIVHKREVDEERLRALTAKLTPAPPASSRTGGDQ